jgi:hypothetical protein
MSKIKIRKASCGGFCPAPTLYLSLNRLPNHNPPLTPTPSAGRGCRIAHGHLAHRPLALEKKRGQESLCEAPFGPFRQRFLTPFFFLQ